MATATLAMDEVKCIDEMGGSFRERFGNDEIWILGIGVDSNANVHLIKPAEVFANFDDGDVKRFSPARALVSLPHSGQPTDRCSAVLVLAEQQPMGGMDKVMHALANTTKTQIAQLKSQTGAAFVRSTRSDQISDSSLESIKLSVTRTRARSLCTVPRTK